MPGSLLRRYLDSFSETSALSQLKIGVGALGSISDAAGNKEVSHAEEVYRPADGTRTTGVGASRQETEGDRPESPACPDAAQGRCGRCQLDRSGDRRGLRLPHSDRGKGSSAAGRT